MDETKKYVDDYVFSLHEFRLIIESGKSKTSIKDSILEQKTLLQSSGINQSLSNKKSKEIRLKCNYVGEQGWVISPFWKPRKDETWYDTWFWMAYNNKAEKIIDYFLENDYSLLNNIRGFSRFEIGRADWFCEAEDAFAKRMFTSCSMLLTAILEESVRRCPIEGWRKQVTVFFDDLICKNIEDYYEKNLEPLNRYIETVLLLPSIDGFLNKYFKSGYPFGKDKSNNDKIEPSFLERNWLMHGMTKREVTESDCIKLFNVIGSLHYIQQTLFQGV